MKLKADRLSALIAETFVAAGCEAAESGRIGDYLVRANLNGHDSHGVIRVQMGGAAAVPGTLLLWNLGNNIPGDVDVGAPIFPYAAFPEYYTHVLLNPVAIGPDDCGQWN